MGLYHFSIPVQQSGPDIGRGEPDKQEEGEENVVPGGNVDRKIAAVCDGVSDSRSAD